jgi:hypothetical protein
VAEVGDTVVGVAKVGNGRISCTFMASYATNHACEAAIVFIDLSTTKDH